MSASGIQLLDILSNIIIFIEVNFLSVKYHAADITIK